MPAHDRVARGNEDFYVAFVRYEHIKADDVIEAHPSRCQHGFQAFENDCYLIGCILWRGAIGERADLTVGEQQPCTGWHFDTVRDVAGMGMQFIQNMDLEHGRFLFQRFRITCGHHMTPK